MYIRRINRGSPEKVYITVRNCMTATTLFVGYPALWAYADTNFNDGVNVTQYSSVDHMPWMLAGVVVRQPLHAGEYGMVQVFGLCDAVQVTAYGGATWNWTSVFTSILTLSTDCMVAASITAYLASLYSGVDILVRPAHWMLNGQTTPQAATSGQVQAFIRGM